MIEQPACAEPSDGSLIASGEGWRFAGALTFDNAAQVFASSRALALPANGSVDFSAIARADSAALAVMIALKRRATTQGSPLSIQGVPASLRSLAVVYGVENLID
ncbi:MAG TPA: STAS domain-containing protein [Casimicrobiaceae bacterium]|nr:STAS domain-containing protein [Casimicrobiaceae bacterium]